jgi:hypothetical protein
LFSSLGGFIKKVKLLLISMALRGDGAPRSVRLNLLIMLKNVHSFQHLFIGYHIAKPMLPVMIVQNSLLSPTDNLEYL